MHVLDGLRAVTVVKSLVRRKSFAKWVTQLFSQKGRAV